MGALLFLDSVEWAPRIAYDISPSMESNAAHNHILNKELMDNSASYSV